ncbi:MAG: phosphotransferase enzyme family protein [Acidimicrobiia bacterium]
MPTEFTELTERGRALRLRSLALAALAEYDVEVRGLRLLQNSWNCVFRVDTYGRPVVIRVTLPGYGHDVRTVRAEVDFMKALAASTDIGVPGVLENRSGDLVTVADAPGVPEPRSCVVFEWIGGKVLGDQVTEARWEALGDLMGRMHVFSHGWTPPDGFDVITYDRVFHYEEPNVLFEPGRADLQGLDSLLQVALDRADEHISEVNRRSPLIVTHGDLHQWNVMVNRGVLSPIDFEDLQYASPLLDVATTLFYVRSRSDYAELGSAFRSGYERHLPWVEAVPGELDRLMVARSLDLMNVVVLQPEIDVGDWKAFVARREEIARVAVGELSPIEIV